MSYDLKFKFVLIIPLPHDNAILIVAYGGNSILVCEGHTALALFCGTRKWLVDRIFGNQSEQRTGRLLANRMVGIWKLRNFN